MQITHYPQCNASYPEKPVNEKPQAFDEIDIGDGEIVYSCSDCGAFIIGKKEI